MVKNDLIDRYIYAVTKHMKSAMKKDVAAELETIIQDMLEERCEDVIPTERDIKVVLEENGEQGSRMGVPQTSIGSGKQYYFWIVAGGMFYVLGRTTVNFTVKLSTSGSVQMGYINNSGIKTRTYSGIGSSHSTSFTIPFTGYYRFYVTNQSSGTLQITGGTISF